MKFSLITPVNVWNEERRSQFYRAVRSVVTQSFKSFEWIVINDGSTLEFEIPKKRHIKVYTVPHGERIIATNKGFSKAKGEWICFLDSDDEIVFGYFEKLKSIIEMNPDYKMFNFGCEYRHKDGTFSKREPFQPKEKEIGHEEFGGGNIPNGTFIFHRSIYENLGGFPPDVTENIDCTEINYPAFKGQDKPYVRDLYMNTPFDFSAYAQIEFPELRKYYMVDHEAEPEKILKELGNPWGNDMYLFYKYTRKYHSKPIPEYLYTIYPK